MTNFDFKDHFISIRFFHNMTPKEPLRNRPTTAVAKIKKEKMFLLLSQISLIYLD